MSAKRAFAVNSGMTALDVITRLVKAGEEVIAGNDLYGGKNPSQHFLLPSFTFYLPTNPISRPTASSTCPQFKSTQPQQLPTQQYTPKPTKLDKCKHTMRFGSELSFKMVHVLGRFPSGLRDNRT